MSALLLKKKNNKAVIMSSGKPAYFAQYIQQNIQDPLEKALTEAAICQPSDPIEFIAQFLLKIVKSDFKKKQTQETQRKWSEEDDQLQHFLEQKKEREKQKEIETSTSIQRENEFFQNLDQNEVKLQAIQQWVNFVGTKFNCNVYIAQKEIFKNVVLENVEENVDENQPGEVEGLIYNVVSEGKGQEFILDQVLISKSRKFPLATLDLFQSPAPDKNENNDQEQDKTVKIENALTARKKENVFMLTTLQFFKYPKVGSYLAFEVVIPTFLHHEALQQKSAIIVIINEANFVKMKCKKEYFFIVFFFFF
ncbi:hypothetical protein RFI_03894 [Reticulomyxa filosa]|uniref:Uncharacterized protein n=1 Tax=Reticulomyxa filosa TaxID=46433 RepID=X6P4T1_RETFI|nr:hypothetical protein RFI_03894 [Reticulomyxa filosa]|eukprot:ETO33211.1 hypothetical protein RFI_03894 [Reticulomyxa filosa]